MFKLSRLGLIVIIVTLLAVLMGGSYALIAYTPLRNFIPGYPDATSRQQMVDNSIRIDSLEGVVARWEYYARNLQRIVEGEDPVQIDSLVRAAANGSQKDINDLRRRDSLLRQTVREEDEFGLSTAVRRDIPIEGMHFFTPVKGVVSQGFVEKIHPYAEISAPAGTVVASVLDGTVVSAGWTDEGGYSVTIQHEQDIISVYEHNQKLLCLAGDRVKAGQPVALVGSTGTLSGTDHLHFELWHKGTAVDPAIFISF